MKISFGVAAAIMLLSSGAAYAGAPGWTISESSGRVVVLRGGVSKIAVRGGSLSPGDLVSTAGNSRAVIVRGGEYLVVSPNSRIRIADPVTSGGFTQIIQDLGNTVFRIKKKTTPHFAVETPYLAAVVKGTTFSVTVTDAGTAVQVTEGLVQVSTNDGGATHLVRPGDIGFVDAAMPLRLKIEGKEAQTIDSPNKPSVTTAPSANIAAAATTAFAEEALNSAPLDSDAASNEVAPVPQAKEQAPVATSMFDSVIGAAVSEGPVKLEAVSGGLVSGDSTLLAVLNNVRTSGSVEPTPVQQVPLSESPPAPVAEDPPPVEVVVAPTLPVDGSSVTATGSVVISPVPVVGTSPVTDIAPPVEVVIAPSPPINNPPVDVVAVVDASNGNGNSNGNGGDSTPVVVTAPTEVAAVVDVSDGNGNGNTNRNGGNSTLVVVTVPVEVAAVVDASNGNGNGNANGNGGNSTPVIVTAPTEVAAVVDVSGGNGSGNGNANGNGGNSTPVVVTAPTEVAAVIDASNGNGNGNSNGNGNGNGRNSTPAVMPRPAVLPSDSPARPTMADIINRITEVIREIRANLPASNGGPGGSGRGR